MLRAVTQGAPTSSSSARLRGGATAGLAFFLAACVPQTRPEGPASEVSAPRPYSRLGLEGVIGNEAAAIIRQLGRPDLDYREGSARKLQFLGPACVLDVYLYPPARGGDPVATHVDARLLDGREMDRPSCVAALLARQQSR